MPAEIESDVDAQEASDQNEETSSTITVIKSVHEYEVRPRKDHCGGELISWLLPFDEPVENAVESVYPRRCQMNRRHLKSIFLMRLI